MANTDIKINWDETTMDFVDTHGLWKHYSIEGVGSDGNDYVGTACVFDGSIEEIIDIELK